MRFLIRVSRRLLALAAAGAALAGALTAARATRPGRGSDGTILLPDGWRIAPVGRHLSIGDLPLAMTESPDGRYLLVTDNGYARPSLVLVDLARGYVRSRTAVDNAWLGLAWSPDGTRVYTSAARESAVKEFRFEKEKLTPARSFPMPSQEIERSTAPGEPPGEGGSAAFTGGLAVHPSGKRLYAVNVLGQTLSAVDLESGGAPKTVPLPAEPYTCAVSPDGTTLAVSLWGGGRVLFLDAATLEVRGEAATGEHPNALLFSRDGARLFVACASTNAVWAVDVAARAAREQISVAMHPQAPPGSTPNSLGLSPDGRTLLVANANNNVVAVVDVSAEGAGRTSGFLPAGWYPTDAQFSRDGRQIRVLSGKGLLSQANPRGPQPISGYPPGQTTRDLLTGTLSFVPAPDARTLAAWTKTAYELMPYRDATRLAPAGAPKGSPVPSRVGGPSPIRHVFYVIRENRTYDQILGDVAAGEGDPSLCLFGEEVTPNAHALASEFVLLDGFYVNAEVSYDGHAYSTGAYATDVVEKIWPMNYANRGGEYLSEGGGPLRNPFGNLSAPPRGYLWDECNRKGVSVRSYGEFVHDPHPAVPRPRPPKTGERRTSAGPYAASVPGLEGRIAPRYPPFDLTIPDNRRVDLWLAEFREFEKNGDLPALSILRLGNDHTSYTNPAYPTPRAMIAENDLALGRLVEAISKSRYWKESAIFVLEDDAQNGPDHVDCHRSVAFVLSPWTRRGGAVDSALYTTCGVLRTIELILGLEPLSQCDAAAAPLYGAFRAQADPTPFEHREPRIRIDEPNAGPPASSALFETFDPRRADALPDVAFNEILWKSVRGAGSRMPPPVHAPFIRPTGGSGSGADADDD